MAGSDEENWFAKNLTAVPGGITGNCSACVFRNYQKYCAKMSCTYFDNDADFIESVYWRSVETHANIATWPELVNWFNTTDARKIMDISKAVLTKAVLENRR